MFRISSAPKLLFYSQKNKRQNVHEIPPKYIHEIINGLRIERKIKRAETQSIPIFPKKDVCFRDKSWSNLFRSDKVRLWFEFFSIETQQLAYINKICCVSTHHNHFWFEEIVKNTHTNATFVYNGRLQNIEAP